MTRHFSGTSDHMDGGTPAFTAKPGALGVWRYAAAQPGQTDLYALVSDGSTANRFALGGDLSNPSGKAGAIVNTSWQGLSTTIPTNNAWHFHLASFSTGNAANGYVDGVKGTATGVGTPAGINHQQVGGRGSADLAYATFWTRVPNDIEEAFLRGGGNPRNLPNLVNFYYVTASSGTETDRVGSANLTVTGTSAPISSGPPPVASFWTAAAQGNQTATQGSTFPAIDLTTKFEQLSGSVDWTGSILQVGAAGTALSANGAGTTSNLLTVNGTVPAVGSYVSIAGGAKTPVLFVSGQTLLIGTAQSWNNADTVTPYPVAALTALTGNGYTITANVTGGTVGAGAVGTYANCLYRATQNSLSTAIGDSALFTYTVAASGAAPSFSAGPTLTTANTDGYTFGATCNQTATWHIGAYVKGSATPSVANVKAGAGTGFVAHVTQALTAATPGSASVTGLTFPFYDVYHVVTNGSGDSALSSNLALYKAPPTGKQYVPLTLNTISAITRANPVQITTSSPHGRTTGDWVEVFGAGGMTEINGAWAPCSVVDATHLTIPSINSTAYTVYTSGGNVTWGRSSIANASTVVVSGDVLIADAVDLQGNAVTFTSEGVAAFATNVPDRQSFVKDVYDTSAGAFIGTASDYENDLPPQPPGQNSSIPVIFFTLNQATSADISTFFTDPQGDPLTITALTALPPNRSLVGNSLTGTALANATTLITFQAANLSGETATIQINALDGLILVPNGVGLPTPEDAASLALSNYLSWQFGVQDDATPGGPAPAGTVIIQNPSANDRVPPGSTIIFTISSGHAPTIDLVVPDVTSAPTDQTTATIALQAAGFVVVVPQAWTGTQKVFQNPPAGSQLPTGSVVRLLLIGGTPPTRRIKLTPKKGNRKPAPYLLRRPKRTR